LNFEELGLSEQILESISAMNFRQATPVQQLSIPTVLAGKDLIACAQTGTGKTAAYLLPILQKITQAERGNYINTLVIVPTRELALQIDQQLTGFSYFLPVSSIPVYGGSDGSTWEQQKSGILQGADILIATPGRLIQHMNLGYVDLSKLKHLVLDEADRMLDMGFYDDIMKIVRTCNTDRQTLMFSATMPPRIREMTRSVMKEPEQVNIAISKPAAGITQEAYMVYDAQKINLVKHILKEGDYPSVIIFSSTKRNVKALDETLRRLKFSARGIHSDLEQSEREKVLLDFRNRETQIIVATDVLSRGIDIENISLVINFDVPVDAEDYVHRVGRTARAASKGRAITFINDKEQRKFARIEKLIGYEVTKVPLPEELGEGFEYDPNKKVPRSPGDRSEGRHRPDGRRSDGRRSDGRRSDGRRSDGRPQGSGQPRSEGRPQAPAAQPASEGQPVAADGQPNATGGQPGASPNPNRKKKKRFNNKKKNNGPGADVAKGSAESQG
jgi:superfamily II DNA/RNA helicase